MKIFYLVEEIKKSKYQALFELLQVEKHKATDESGADSEASDGSAASDRSDQEEDTEDEDEEEVRTHFYLKDSDSLNL